MTDPWKDRNSLIVRDACPEVRRFVELSFVFDGKSSFCHSPLKKPLFFLDPELKSLCWILSSASTHLIQSMANLGRNTYCVKARVGKKLKAGQ
jgi:hypothetical protein